MNLERIYELIEHVPHGKCPEQPMTNRERLASFRVKMAALADVGYNAVFLGGRRACDDAGIRN